MELGEVLEKDKTSLDLYNWVRWVKPELSVTLPFLYSKSRIGIQHP